LWPGRTPSQPIVELRTTAPAADGLHFFVGTEFCAPGLGPKNAKRLRLRVGHHPLDEVDPELYGVTLMEAQRQVPVAEAFGLDGIYVVGGHCLQTKVLVAGVVHRIVHTWLDRIAERIDLFARPSPQLALACGE